MKADGGRIGYKDGPKTDSMSKLQDPRVVNNK